MNRRHLLIVIAVAMIAILLAVTIFSLNNRAAVLDGPEPANSPNPGYAGEPAETTGNSP